MLKVIYTTLWVGIVHKRLVLYYLLLVKSQDTHKKEKVTATCDPQSVT